LTLDKITVESFPPAPPLHKAARMALAYPAFFMEYDRVKPALGNATLERFLRRFLYREIMPALEQNPDDGTRIISAALEYLARGPQMMVTLTANGSICMHDIIVPCIERQLNAGGSVSYSAFVVASWLTYMRGIGPGVKNIEVIDPHRNVMRTKTSLASDPAVGLHGDIFGSRLCREDVFLAALRQHHQAIYAHGMRAALESLMREPRPASLRMIKNTPS